MSETKEEEYQSEISCASHCHKKSKDIFINKSFPRLLFTLTAFTEMLTVTVGMATTHVHWFKNREAYFNFIDIGAYLSGGAAIMALMLHIYYNTRFLGNEAPEARPLINYSTEADRDFDDAVLIDVTRYGSNGISNIDNHSWLRKTYETLSLPHAIKSWGYSEKANLINSLTSGFYLSYILLNTIQNLFHFGKDLSYNAGLAYYIVPGCLITYAITRFAPVSRNTWDQRKSYLESNSIIDQKLQHTYYQKKLCFLIGLNTMKAINSIKFYLTPFGMKATKQLTQTLTKALPYISCGCLLILPLALYKLVYQRWHPEPSQRKNSAFYNMYRFMEFIKLTCISAVGLNATYVLLNNKSNINEAYLCTAVVISAISAYFTSYMNTPKLNSFVDGFFISSQGVDGDPQIFEPAASDEQSEQQTFSMN